mmetsp:Transcript_53892/g.157214  ORF Transcript_53892/g.157214 Transcript_53892/m.157214 type:complete len:262 (+) Transcript_53892:126-911(+)
MDLEACRGTTDVVNQVTQGQSATRVHQQREVPPPRQVLPAAHRVREGHLAHLERLAGELLGPHCRSLRVREQADLPHIRPRVPRGLPHRLLGLLDFLDRKARRSPAKVHQRRRPRLPHGLRDPLGKGVARLRHLAPDTCRQALGCALRGQAHADTDKHVLAWLLYAEVAAMAVIFTAHSCRYSQLIARLKLAIHRAARALRLPRHRLLRREDPQAIALKAADYLEAQVASRETDDQDLLRDHIAFLIIPRQHLEACPRVRV